MQDIKPQEIAGKKEIGNLDGKPVYEISLKGGLYIIATPNGNGVKVLGSGPHPVIAKHIARKINPNLTITELMKSEELEIRYFERLVPYYTQMVHNLNALNG